MNTCKICFDTVQRDDSGALRPVSRLFPHVDDHEHTLAAA